MPVISIVVPLYNKEKEISYTLDTIFRQTISDFEIVVVNDGSTDNSAEKVKKTKDKRVHLIHKQNGGLSSARNVGIREATSDFIAFLDADDQWASDHLDTLLRLRKNFPDAGIYTTYHASISEDGSSERLLYKGIPGSPWEGVIPNYFVSMVKGANPLWASSCAAPKKIIEEVGMFDISMRKSQDVPFFNSIASKYPVAFSWRGIAYYRKDAENRMSKKPNQHLLDSAEIYLSKILIKPENVTILSPLRHIYAYNCKLAVSSAQYALLTLERPDIARRCLARVRHPSYLFPRYLLWTCLSRLPQGLFKKIRLRLRRMRGRG